MDCFVAALLAMTAATFRDSGFNLQRADRVCIRVPAARSARVMHDLAPKITEGAGNAGCATHPRPVCIGRKHTVVTTGRPHQPAFPARWFYGLYRALPGDRAVLPPSFLRSLLLKNLAPASGRQDHTTSPSATAPLALRRYDVHRIPHPTSVTTRTPLCSRRDGCEHTTDLGF